METDLSRPHLHHTVLDIQVMASTTFTDRVHLGTLLDLLNQYRDHFGAQGARSRAWHFGKHAWRHGVFLWQ